MDSLPEELKMSIISKLKNPKDIGSFLSTNKLNKKLIDLYPTNHPNFIKAYNDSLKTVATRKISISKIDPDALLKKCEALYEYMNVEFVLPKKSKTYILPTNVYQKVQIFNKAIVIYLKMIIKDNSYIYYLSKIISFKSGLVDLYGIRAVRKYALIEFELYKLYILSYLLKPSALYSKEHLRDAAYWIFEFSRDGITGFVAKARPSQIVCAAFIKYYFSNSSKSLADFITTYKNTPSQNFIISSISKEKILKQCIVFMLTDKHAVSTFTKEACALDLSLIEPTQDYKKLYNTTIEEA